MTFKLSQRSLDKLKGVNDDLVYITQEYRGTFKIQCVDSFSIEEFLGKQK